MKDTLFGKIHSTETFGTLDGPGVRFVVFFQGCKYRCIYCHNPDTWQNAAPLLLSAEDIISKMKRNLPFYKTGGISATGGEPLLQIEFLTELFKLSKAEGIHTCLDTSGQTFCYDDEKRLSQFDELLRYTDLVMLDIKAYERGLHKRLTGSYNENVLDFARYLDKKNIPTRIRHVIVPGYTFEKDSLKALGKFIGTLSNIEDIEVLPYHTMGVPKYKSLGIDYPLENEAALSESDARLAKKIILENLK